MTFCNNIVQFNDSIVLTYITQKERMNPLAERTNQYRPPKITVLMPVYNVGKFLPKCLETLMNQTFRDFHLIAVNDGSTDNCLEILRDFESRYNNITIIDQPNAGMSMARNAALALADSKYICFVDSDDYLAPTFLQELYQAITIHDADIACCYYYYHFVESDTLYKYPFRTSGVFNKEEALKKLLKDVQIQSLAWNKIYKRSLFTDNAITFPSMAFEDMAIAHKLFSLSEKVVVINRALYYYNQQNASTLATINAKKINDFILATAMVRASLDQNGVYHKYKKAYRALTRKTGWCCLYFAMKMHRKNKSMGGIWSNMKKIRSALSFCASKEFDFKTYYYDLPGVLSPQEFDKKPRISKSKKEN